MSARHLIAAAAVATVAAVAAGPLAGVGMAADRTPAQIAPGGNIVSVERATARDGWPHPPTTAETRDVAHLALWHARLIRNRGERVAVLCRFNGWTIGRARCGVEYRAGRKRVAAFAVDVKVWEDGSYRFDRRAF